MYELKKMDKKTGKTTTVTTSISRRALEGDAAKMNMGQNTYLYFVVKS